VAYDPDLNWLIFDVENYSCTNISNMLAKFDVPVPQVRVKITVYEIDSEDDEKLGIDFQSWKNNQGADLFSAGGRYRNNWSALYTVAGLNRNQGSEWSSFYNFNPKWNSRYIDFLTAIGKAEIMLTGELCIRNSTSARLERVNHIFYMDDSQSVPGSTEETIFPNTGVGAYELLNNIIGAVTGENTAPANPIQVGKGNQQLSALSGSYGFSMQISYLAVGLDESRFTVTLNNSSLIGFQSNGAPRISPGAEVVQNVSLPHGIGEFAIGGLKKVSVVTSRAGIPLLMDIPYIGYLFSSESKSVKHTELLVVGQASYDAVPQRGKMPRTKHYKRGQSAMVQ
jgi:type II secretory pathway component GspD/PulD (secretin)